MSSQTISPAVPIDRPSPGRDRFVDLLRTFSMATVVLGHWTLPVLAAHGGTLSVGDVFATPGWWTLTWLLQVMPVFFAVGGAAGLHSYRAAIAKGGTARDWLAARLCRFTVPVLPLLAVWLVLPVVLGRFGVPSQPLHVATGAVGQMLWFLAVYLMTVAMVPVMVAAHRRFGLLVVAALGVAVVGVDMLRFGGFPLLGYANELFVWLAVQQLGIAYGAGTFDRLSRRGALGIGVGGLAVTALMVVIGPYPASMAGLPGAAVSNMSPATACLLTLGIGQLGLLFAFRERIVRFGELAAVARWQRFLGPRCMTVYVWHMTAMVIVAGIAVLGFGYGTPAAGTLGWLVVTPVWLTAIAGVLRVLLWLFDRFEQVPVRPRVRPGAVRLGCAVVLVFAGLLGISAWGFGLPAGAVTASTAIAGGLALVLVRRMAAPGPEIHRAGSRPGAGA
jgi:hypothetical protein